jgi:hypothetical protein
MVSDVKKEDSIKDEDEEEELVAATNNLNV